MSPFADLLAKAAAGPAAEDLKGRLPESVRFGLARAAGGESRVQQAVRRTYRRARLREPVPEGTIAAWDSPLRGPRVVPVVDSFDTWDHERQTTLELESAISRAGVERVVQPARTGVPPRIVVPATSRCSAAHAIATVADGAGWEIVPLSSAGPDKATAPLTASALETALRRGGARVFRRVASRGGDYVSGAETGCDIEAWSVVDDGGAASPDDGILPGGTWVAPWHNGWAPYLTPAARQRLLAGPGENALLPHVFDVTEPIDLVYTWVDGSDPAWQARKAEAAGSPVVSALNPNATHESRYLSREELRYSLRSVEMFASWVRKIYIVTDQQVPSWLDLSHPKIHVVDHREIFPAEAPPVFNSHAIESRLHHIPGLSDRYLYLNDDVFFGRPVGPEDFFHSNGVAKFFLSPFLLDVDPRHDDQAPIMSATKNNRSLIEGRFGRTITNKVKHTPHPQIRAVHELLEAENSETYERLARSQFRHPDDLSVAASLHPYVAYLLGRAVPGEISYMYQDLARPDAERNLAALLRTRRFKVFCINDTMSAEEDVVRQSRFVPDFFERYFPFPSPYELRQA